MSKIICLCIAATLAFYAFEARARASTEEISVADVEKPGAPANTVGVNYFGIFYGPSFAGSNGYQPTAGGKPDLDRPVVVKNYLSTEFQLSEQMVLSGTAAWHLQPAHGQTLTLKDPYARLGYDGLVQIGDFNLYGDIRVHFPVTAESRDDDLLTGVQTFQIATLPLQDSRVTLTGYFSARANFYGSQGSGNDLEVYVGPGVSYQISHRVNATLIYELGATHTYGDRPNLFTNNGTDLEPGLQWDITPQITVNPYINILTSERISLRSTSFGMMFNWALL